MRRFWLGVAAGLVLIMGIGTAMLMNQAGAEQVVVEPGWRFTNGYWNYWDPDDRAWYYTDGRHWYTHNNNAWRVYNFDRAFGRKIYREGYVVPKAGPEIVVPSHKVYVAP